VSIEKAGSVCVIVEASVTVPEVPPPLNPLPAVTPVMSPVLVVYPAPLVI